VVGVPVSLGGFRDRHRHGRLHGRPDPGRGPGPAIPVPGQTIQLHPGKRRLRDHRAGRETPERRRDHLGAGLETPDRLEAVARGGRRGAPLLHRPGAAGRRARHRHRGRPVRSPVPGDHPRLRPGLSSTSTCAAGRKPCWTSRHHATPRSRSAPRRQGGTGWRFAEAAGTTGASGCLAAHAQACGCGSSMRITRPGLPTTTAQAGTDLVTTASAPIRA
jgi:hypothetical protein